MSDKIFVDGLFAQKRQNSPAFVISSLSVKVPELIPFLEKYRNNAGYVNIDILLSQKGTQYCQLNDFKPTEKPKVEDTTAIDENGRDLNDNPPF